MAEFVHTSVVPTTVEDVFAWHARPGAMVRLMPPWQPARVVQQAGSLRDGTAILRLPLGLRWVAEHQPDGHRPPHQFADQLAGGAVTKLVAWRHTHRFEREGLNTRVQDIVRTSVPANLLRRMFTYRHQQLADDLASLQRARDWSTARQTVAITGSHGLVGTAISALLTTAGHRVVRLVRRPAHGPDERRWVPREPGPDLLRGVDTVIHLAGAPIAGRFTPAHKATIRDSRVEPTRQLARAAAGTPHGPTTFISASAIGYYGHDRGDRPLTEDDAPGEDFLADVVQQWEAATSAAAGAGLRTVVVRTGVVQSPRGGTLQLLHPLFAAGLGGPLGDGRHWLSWIGIDDLADIYLRAVLDTGVSGPINAVAPRPLRQRDYAQTLAATLARPARLPVPRFGPELLLGRQGATELAFADQLVSPLRLQQLRHTFRHPDLAPALAHLFGRTTEAVAASE
ncbi:MAG TPA: TIGR01777 family oxidoreductase [Segeticoccus sp.]|nr:TIGR01777 family oxidoreductase [Segeticoccus sp.]